MRSLWLAAALILPSAPVLAQTPVVDDDGNAVADHIEVPPSEFLSPEARAHLIARIRTRAAGAVDVAAIRAGTMAFAAQVAAKWQALAPATVRAEIIGGVRTDVVEPAAGIAPANRSRVIMALHGGGFFTGGGTGSADAIPVAIRGKLRVIAVDYRLAPEAHFPAASEDVEQVYRALLKSYRPADIGIYGCSAGGALVAQSMAWFQAKQLPPPGAIGMFCAGAMPGLRDGGDSGAVTPVMNGRPPTTPAQRGEGVFNSYLAGIDPKDPMVAPALSPAILAHFPPTLLVTGTRDVAMSNVLVTNARLLAVGVETQLFVQEGMGHGDFGIAPGTPEATQAYDVIWRWFDRHLGR
jgi:acetyl esterase/lipase